MILIKSFLSGSRTKVLNPARNILSKNLAYQPLNTFFWKKKDAEKKENEDLKKFKELNQEFKLRKDARKFTVTKGGAKSFISEDEKKKQEKVVKKALDNYLEGLKFESGFDEYKFVTVISSISYMYDNSAILNDPRFGTLIEETAQKLREFKDLRNVTLFLAFCSHHKINKPLIWEYFNSVILNAHQKFNFEERLSILSNYTQENASELEEFFELFENAFLKDFKNEKGNIDFIRVYRVFALYRKLDKGSENFFFTIEDLVKANLDEMDMESIVLFLLHYMNDVQLDQAAKHDMISRIEKRLSQSHVFLNNEQLLAVLFAFIKYGRGSDLFYELMEQRTISVIDTFTLDQLQKLLVLYLNLPKHSTSIFKGIEKHVIQNFKKIPRPFISNLLQVFREFGYQSKDLFANMQDYLVKNVFNMENEEFSKNLWAFSLGGNVDELYFKKAAECVKSKLTTYKAKELATIIWSFSHVDFKDNELYDSIEVEVHNKLHAQAYTLKDITLLLWAYVQKVPLRPPTVDVIKSECLRLKQDAEAWDIAIILWGFSKFEGYPIREFFKELQNVTTDLISEMDNYQLSISLRAYAEADVGHEALYKAFVEKALEVVNGLNYSEAISCVYSFSLVSCVDQSMFTEVIQKLIERAKYLQNQIQVSEQKKEVVPEDDLQSVETYLKNEAMEKLKNQ